MASRSAPSDVLALVNVTEPEEGSSPATPSPPAGSRTRSRPPSRGRSATRAARRCWTGFATAEGWGDKLYPWQTQVDVSGLRARHLHVRGDDRRPSDGEGGGPTEDTKTHHRSTLTREALGSPAQPDPAPAPAPARSARTRRPHELARHLVGLQAQETLPPYLSLAARLTSFDPDDVTAGLEDRSLVRLLTHARHRAPARRRRRADAAAVDRAGARARDQDQPEHRPGAGRGPGELPRRALRRSSPAAPSPRRRSGPRWPSASPAYRPTQLGQLARSVAPLVQCPPRGTWRGSGGVVYQYVDRWLGRPLVEPDVEEIVRRYLRAFGPASAADVTAWSGVTRLGPVLKGMDDLVAHRTRTASRCSTFRTASWPTRTSRRRCGCSASTTTSGCPTPAVTG